MYSAINQQQVVCFCYTKTEQYGRSPNNGERSTEFSGDVEGGKERLELKRYFQFH